LAPPSPFLFAGLLRSAHDLRTKGRAAAVACSARRLQPVVSLPLAGCGFFKAEATTAKIAQREIGQSHALEEG
jgi:hypothetical protein